MHKFLKIILGLLAAIGALFMERKLHPEENDDIVVPDIEEPKFRPVEPDYINRLVESLWFYPKWEDCSEADIISMLELYANYISDGGTLEDFTAEYGFNDDMFKRFELIHKYIFIFDPVEV